MRMRIYIAFFHYMNQSIKMHLELSHYSRYGPENLYIYIISYSYYHTKNDVFFSKSKHNYKCDTDFIQTLFQKSWDTVQIVNKNRMQ